MMRIGVIGLIGSWVTLEEIQERPVRQLPRMPILVSVLGFIIGQALADSILLSEEPPFVFVLLALALWGLLGSAALGIPSRSPRNIALLGGAGVAGMFVGVLLWYFGAGFDDTIMWHLDDLHFHNDINLFLGLGLGLFLGLSTRRIATAMILPVVGAAAFVGSVAFIDDLWNFTNWGSFTDWDYSQQWLLSDILGGAFIGGVLGLAWGYLKNPKARAITEEVQMEGVFRL